MSETIMYRGKEIEIIQDESPQNPRTEWDNAGTMVRWHSRYVLGDEQRTDEPTEFMRELACELDPALADRIEFWENGAGYDRCKTFVDSDERINALVEKSLEKNAIMLPLYLYDHSGITMRCSPFSCQWDSGRVGWIYISKKDAIKEWGKKVCTKAVRERAIRYLKGEVETYDHYLTGAVYGYSTGEDSCYGFYGYDHKESGLLEQAQCSIDCQIRREKREEADRLARYHRQVRAWLKHGVPLRYRYNYGG